MMINTRLGISVASVIFYWLSYIQQRASNGSGWNNWLYSVTVAWEGTENAVMISYHSQICSQLWLLVRDFKVIITMVISCLTSLIQMHMWMMPYDCDIASETSLNRLSTNDNILPKIYSSWMMGLVDWIMIVLPLSSNSSIY